MALVGVVHYWLATNLFCWLTARVDGLQVESGASRVSSCVAQLNSLSIKRASERPKRCRTHFVRLISIDASCVSAWRPTRYHCMFRFVYILFNWHAAPVAAAQSLAGVGFLKSHFTSLVLRSSLPNSSPAPSSFPMAPRLARLTSRRRSRASRRQRLDCAWRAN